MKYDDIVEAARSMCNIVPDGVIFVKTVKEAECLVDYFEKHKVNRVGACRGGNNYITRGNMPKLGWFKNCCIHDWDDLREEGVCYIIKDGSFTYCNLAAPERNYSISAVEYITNNFLDINLPQPMNTLRTQIRDRFFKKEETKIVELVELAEELLEPISKLGSLLLKTTSDVNNLIAKLESAIDSKNQVEIKRLKGLLQKAVDETLKDNVMEQLLLVGEKLVEAYKD